jgi:hypothetical protein
MHCLLKTKAGTASHAVAEVMKPVAAKKKLIGV